MGTTEIIMRLSKNQLDKILDDKYLGTLMEQWRDTDHCIDIDKAWHGIHYLFTNSATYLYIDNSFEEKMLKEVNSFAILGISYFIIPKPYRNVNLIRIVFP